MKTARAKPDPAPEAPPLVFEWEGRPRTRWRLAGLIALSLLVHAVAFYVLQVAYVPTGAQLPPPAQVMMVRPEQPDDPPEVRAQSRALAHWLALNDPSSLVEPGALAAKQNVESPVRYVPSYRAALSPFKPLDPPSADVAAPPRPRPPGPVPLPPMAVATPSPPPALPTQVRLTGGIAASAPADLPGVTYQPATPKVLAPTIFLVGVRPGGGTPFLFREAGSGDVGADDFAAQYLAHLPFRAPEVPDATRWGWAEFDWGKPAR